MEAQARIANLTPEEYLEIERHAEHKSEYYQGEIFAMAGASERHNLIQANLIRELGNQLKSSPCKVYPSDMRLKVEKTGLFTYPDVMVVCGKVVFDDEMKDTVVNPTVIIEVLADSTEAYDRGKKFEHYRRIECLREYLLVAQDRCRVEQFTKQEAGLWLFAEASKTNDTVTLAAIDCKLLLSEIFDKVELS